MGKKARPCKAWALIDTRCNGIYDIAWLRSDLLYDQAVWNEEWRKGNRIARVLVTEIAPKAKAKKKSAKK